MTSGDYGKPQTQYEKQTSGGSGGNQVKTATQSSELAGITDHLEREFGSEQWFNSAVSQIIPLFRKLQQANGESVCLEQHGSTVSIMKTRQTSQGSQSR